MNGFDEIFKVVGVAQRPIGEILVAIQFQEFL